MFMRQWKMEVKGEVKWLEVVLIILIAKIYPKIIMYGTTDC